MITDLPIIFEAPEGEAAWGAGADGHPMRAVTRAVAFDPDGWTPERQAEVVALFDDLAPDWNTRNVPGRELPLLDALDRGLAAAPAPAGTTDDGHGRGLAIELGGGTGLDSAHLAARVDTVVTIDISPEMLARIPDGPTFPVQGDGSRLPLADGSVDALVLVNMFLFPQEAERVLAPHGVIVWVNSRGPETPIHLTADEVDAALPGRWDGVGSQAGWGTWSVHWRSVDA